jgi:outer membrane protein assembly factor BamB
MVASAGECCAAPAVAGGVLYLGLSTGLVALEAATGQERWRWESGGYAVSTPAVAAGDVYAGGFATFAAGSHAGFLFVVDAATGRERWRYAAGEWVSATPVVAGGAAYIGTWAGSLVSLAD